MDKELNLIRLRLYLKPLLPIKREVFSLIKQEQLSDSLSQVYVSSQDMCKELFVAILMKLDHKVSYKVMNAYRLLDIMLEHDLEYKSASHITEEYLFLFSGYDEMENRRQGDVINQIMQLRSFSNKKTILFHKGNQRSLADLGVKIKPIVLETKPSRTGGML